ncbi:GPI inositol-deacylase PGAP1-like protein [Heracleum sosnowskyi]|uniref:GPI inositol-deacylase PGAP1-like protein n=1 Tax=Heracleum sosnowskyi TaxID=360622 RepID=A0AAD8J9J4_9APIA|nr:GPI inositol-deacylase PGAP1-like protein [Heracleum sosnowskyi]
MSEDTVMIESSPLPSQPPTIYLAGPPEIHKSPSSGHNPALNSFNSITPPTRKGFTQGLSRTYLTSSNPCLDFFFHVVPSTPKETLITYLESSWGFDSLTTLKLICNLRGVRGTGKGNKEGFYTAVLWLQSFHPKTLAKNVEVLVGFGYFKDLPEILHRLMQDASWFEKREFCQKKKAAKARGGKGVRLRRKGRRVERCGYDEGSDWFGKRPFSLDDGGGDVAWRRKTREARVFAEKKKVEKEMRKAKQVREEKKVVVSTKAVMRYVRDPDYRFLYETVSAYFADCLKMDMKMLELGKLGGISLAAKWCPSLNSCFDKSTLLCESIARKIFPKEMYDEYEGLEDAHYAYRVRDRLRKQVLVPLRKALQLPEVYMGVSEWGSIPYNRVPSVAMTNYKEKFLKHDRLRFDEYLEKVKSGKATIAAGALLPHKIIASLNDGDSGEVAELQWKRIVNDLSSKGKLKNCIAVCDVSSNMEGVFLDVCLALGVLVSELSEDPWSGNLITFSTNPKLEKVEGEDLRSKVDFVRRLEVESNTDFQKVFDVILKVAEKGKLKEDQMIKKIFVFSSMEFDNISENIWETDYQAITRKYTKKGYGSCVPEIVFWNLTDSKATPVPSDKPGVALVSGYSKNLMTLFLEDKGTMTPESVMEVAISGEEYSKLVVVD